MKILALADLDGEVPPRGALRDVYRAAGIEAVVFAGSVLPPGDVPPREARRLYTAFFDALAALTLPTVVVPGHLDTPTDLFGRVAARYAAVNFNPSTSGQTFAAWVKSQAGTSLSGAGTVCISFPNSTSNVGDPVKVVVTSGTFSWQALSGVMSIAGLPTTMRGSATMRLEAPPTVYGPACA